MKKIAVYTAFAEARECQGPFLESLQPHPEIDFFCITESNDGLPEFVLKHPPTRASKDPVRRFSEAKVAGLSLFADYTWIVWVDPRMALNCPNLVDYLWHRADPEVLLHFFANDIQNCFFEEANRAFLHPLDRPGVLSRQINRYLGEGLGRRAGLAHTGFLVVAGGDQRIRAFSEDWGRELVKGSRCDLFSFEFVRWKQKARSEFLRGLWYRNPFVYTEQSTDRPFPPAPLRLPCAGEWFHRVLRAEELFSHVLYRPAAQRTSPL